MKYLLVFVTFFSLMPDLSASEVITLDNSTTMASPHGRSEIFHDKTGSMTIEEVVSKGKFIPNGNSTPSMGMVKGKVWVRFSLLTNEPSIRYIMELAYPLMDRVSAFQVEGKSIKKLAQTGYAERVDTRPLLHRNFMFPLRLKKEPSTIYLELANSDRMEIPVRLYSEIKFYNHIYFEQYFMGIYLGMLIMMFLIQLILYIYLRDKSYASLAVFIAAYGFFQLTQNGYLYIFIFPSWLQGYQFYIPLTITLVLMATSYFTMVFLQLDKMLPKFNRALRGTIIIGAMITIVSFFLSNQHAIMLTAGFTLPALLLPLTAGIVMAVKRSRFGYYYLFSFLILMVSAMVYALKTLGIVPYTLFTNYIMQVGSAVSLLALTFAIADRYRTIQQDRQSAHDKMLMVEREAHKENERLLTKFLLILGSAIESRDKYTGGHVERVAEYARILAGHLDCEQHFIGAVYLGAIVHDLGKIAVRDEILNKPGKLTDEERKEMELHPEIGQHLLEQIENIPIAVNIARYHQEKWDGTGYPSGIKGTAIPLEARIVTIADYWDAIITDRPYRKAMSLEKALAVMAQEKGRAFDPELYDLFFNEELNIYMTFNGSEQGF